MTSGADTTSDANASSSPISINGVVIEPTFAEAFDMKATAIVITAMDRHWLDAAVASMTGFGTSVIACGIETAVDRFLPPDQTPDGRVGARVLAMATSGGVLSKKIATRIGQCILTCPTAAAYADIDPVTTPPDKRVAMGKTVRFFGDGHQISKRIGNRQYWRIPVMEGEFLCEHSAGRVDAIGGGNFLLIGQTTAATCHAARVAVEAIGDVADVITPFPGGVARSGSKVGSKYPTMFASTNDAYCPTLRGRGTSQLADDEHCVLEIVIDGLSFDAIHRATRIGITAACQTVGYDDGLRRISAGNYGGKLGRHHFHLHQVMS